MEVDEKFRAAAKIRQVQTRDAPLQFESLWFRRITIPFSLLSIQRCNLAFKCIGFSLACRLLCLLLSGRIVATKIIIVVIVNWCTHYFFGPTSDTHQSELFLGKRSIVYIGILSAIEALDGSAESFLSPLRRLFFVHLLASKFGRCLLVVWGWVFKLYDISCLSISDILGDVDDLANKARRSVAGCWCWKQKLIQFHFVKYQIYNCNSFVILYMN